MANSRNLTGMAHGAAGIGTALFELWRATSDSRFLYAAERAFAYEQSHFDQTAQNWPDFRNSDVSEMLATADGRIKLAQMVSDRRIHATYRPRFMSAWCHGAPGIGLARLRAFELTGQPSYLEEARVAARCTIENLRIGKGNYSLCHGVFGNCELLLELSRHDGDEASRETLERCVIEGLDLYERDDSRWPSGVLDSAPDPSLMLGEAGVALFLLRVSMASVPSVLLLRSNAERAFLPSDDRLGARQLASEEIRAAYGMTLDRFVRLGAIPLETVTQLVDVQASFVRTKAAISHVIRAAASPRRQLLLDAYRHDLAVGELAESNPLLTVSLFASLTHEEQILDEKTSWTLSPLVRVVRQRYCWTEWAASGMRMPAPSLGDEYFLLVFRYDHIESRKINAVTYLLLATLAKRAKRAATLAQLLRAASVAVPDAEDDHLRQFVLSQLSAFQLARIVEGNPPVDSPSSGTVES